MDRVRESLIFLNSSIQNLISFLHQFGAIRACGEFVEEIEKGLLCRSKNWFGHNVVSPCDSFTAIGEERVSAGSVQFVSADNKLGSAAG
jgi:hypothetical protein